MEQIELNKKLYHAICCGKIDRAYIEELLQLGADPLGSADESEPDEHILGRFFCEANDFKDAAQKMAEIVQLFCRYGMRIQSLSIPDDKYSRNPLWALSFHCSENGLRTLKVLLDNGLDCESAEILVDHIWTDMDMCGGCAIDNKRFLRGTVCCLKMIMLVASYPHIIDNSKYIQECIELDRNDRLNLSGFRSWDDFRYEIDISTCTNVPYGLQNATVTITNIASEKAVWSFLA